MINRVVLVGRFTKDPELRTATSGNSVCSFTLAVDSKMKNADGTRGTCFMGCVCFGQSAETVAKFTRKGSLVGVEGYLNQRKYQRQDGSMASVIEVICDSVQFLEPKGSRTYDEVPPFDDVPAPAANGGQNQTPAEEDSRNLDSLNLPDDDLPF